MIEKASTDIYMSIEAFIDLYAFLLLYQFIHTINYSCIWFFLFFLIKSPNAVSNVPNQ